MSLWTEIRTLVSENKTARLADRLVALTDEERAELAGRLPGLVKELREALTEKLRAEYHESHEDVISWQVTDGIRMVAGGLLLAGVGVIGGPAAAVSWMTSRDVNRRWARDIDVAQVCRVAAARSPEWRRDVAARLALRVRRPADRIAPLAVALLRASGVTPPDHDPLVAAWLAAPNVPDDPLLPVLLPRIFTAGGAGRVLREERLDPRPTHWLAAAARGLPRQEALDGCVSRFLRGGDVQDLRFFVRLHTLLEPTPAESAARLRDYLRLLPSAPGTVAELAAGQVRAAPPLGHADLVEAVEALTFRAEAKLAVMGLRWLDEGLRATPDAAGDFVPALTTAYAHTSFEVRDRAVGLTLKHAGLFADHAEAVRDGFEHLPADQRARLVARFGGEVPVEERERKEFPPLPEPRQAGPFPEPSLHPDAGEWWVRGERWLAAFVAGIADDRARLSAELKPRVERGEWRAKTVLLDPDAWQSALAAELVSPGSLPEVPPVQPQKAWDGASYSVGVRAITRGDEPPPEPRRRRGFMMMSGYHADRYLEDDSPLRVIDITWTSDEGPAAAVARENGEEVPFVGGRVHLNRSPAGAEHPPREDAGADRSRGDADGAGDEPARWDVLTEPASHEDAGDERARPEGGGVGRSPLSVLIEAASWEDAEEEDYGFAGYGPSHPRARLRSRSGIRYDDSEEAMPSHVLDDVYERMAELGVARERIAAMEAGQPVPPPGPDEPLVEVTVSFMPPRLRSFLPPELPEPEEWRRRSRLPRSGAVSPLHDFLLHRYAELARALLDDALPPVLLATPTSTSGLLDPGVLVDRLATCAAAGVEPLPADLAQALMRLPRGRHPAAAERAAGIGSEAARSAARWLAGGGMTGLVCGHRWQHMVSASMVDFGDDEPDDFTEVRLRPVVRVTEPTGHRLIDEVLLREPYDWRQDESRNQIPGWAAMVPSHPEIMVVNALPFLLHGDYWGSGLVPLEVAGLELAEGPLGEAAGVMLAFMLAGQLHGTLPLLLALAARGTLPCEAVGRQLALVLRRTWRETRAAIAALTGLAEAGGHHEVWRILRGLLPELVPATGTHRRITVTHTTWVAFAAEVAGWADARGEIPVIAGHAGARRKSRFAHECRNLHALLTAP
ncbi:hypothetical protein ABZW11_30580 [Nonomuraea sp. NPDC004580]|uniref:hypothetical protein n=1 Tax=Nonomuraea sp. NPDC004580 TaxID=3154552 RepID=UPI0033BCF63C